MTVEIRLDYDGQNQTLQLAAGAIPASKNQAGKYTVELVGVEPYPQYPDVIETQDYRATFKVENQQDQAYDQYCRSESDCVLETQLQPQCSHLCFDADCPANVRLCQAYNAQSAGNRALANLQCKQNEACRMPNQVTCIDNECRVS